MEELFMSDQPLQAEAALYCLHLLSIACRDREEAVATHDSALREVPHVAVISIVGPLVRLILVDHVVVRTSAIEAEIINVHILHDNRQRTTIGVRHQLVDGVDALIAEVVDNENTPRLQKPVCRTHPVGEVDREERRLPVVRKKHHAVAVRGAARCQNDGSLQGCQAEEREAEEVVRVLHALLSVVIKAARPMVARVVDKDVVHPFSFANLLVLVEVLYLVLAAHEPDTFIRHPCDVLVVVVHRADRHDAVAALCELHRQRRRHQRQAPGLRPGTDLAGDHNYGYVEVQRSILRLGHFQRGILQLFERDVTKQAQRAMAAHHIRSLGVWAHKVASLRVILFPVFSGLARIGRPF
mmetsp:Transcript_203/g.391  ORF Transcript_203/g.391 Transcript_203/m.391 type:complete len:354 (+) Transcript_203:878-1939(+)